MLSFPPAFAALLERIEEKSEVDGWPPFRTMKDPAYSNMFASIWPGILRSGLVCFRNTYGKTSSLKRKS